MNILALIPARGGSKGIPRKNLLPLLGKPLIAYTIEQAKSSRFISRVIVSTDDAEIAAVAKQHGAEVPFIRPAEFAADLSPDIDVFKHALTWLKNNEGYVPEMVVHLRPTGPLRSVPVVDRAIEQMIAHPEATALRSVNTPLLSPFKMWRLNGPYLEPLARVEGQPEAHSMPRQILPAVYWQNGYVDIVRASTVLDRGQIAGDKILPFIVDEPIVELDYPDDVPRLEAALRDVAAGRPISKSQSHSRRIPV